MSKEPKTQDALLRKMQIILELVSKSREPIAHREIKRRLSDQLPHRTISRQVYFLHKGGYLTKVSQGYYALSEKGRKFLDSFSSSSQSGD